MKKYVLIPFDEYHGEKLPTKENLQRKVSVESVVSLLPRNYQHKAKAILDHVENNNDLDWNEKGEIIIEGETIPNSHITDLIKRSLYSYKNFNPLGYDRFKTALQKSNLPQSLLQHGGGDSVTQRIPPPGLPSNTEWIWHPM